MNEALNSQPGADNDSLITRILSLLSIRVFFEVAMTDRQTDIIKELTKAAAETEDFFRGLSPERLEAAVYADGAHWNVRQVLAHLITIERSMHRLFRNILEGGPGAPKDFDIERFNRSQPRKLEGLSLDELLAQFHEVRRETISIVASMKEADFDRTGWHPFHGDGRLERFIRWAYEHIRLHQDDIRRALAGS
jgi:hypothetical protein